MTIKNVTIRIADYLFMMRLSIRLQMGRKFWIVPLAVLAWPLFHVIRLLLISGAEGFAERDAQNFLIGLPLAVVAIGMGVRIIAGEIEQRTLEVAYTVPGGCRRIWIAKLAAIIILLLLSEALLAIVTAIFFTSFPLAALYGAFQGAVFYLVLAMGLGALFKSEIPATLVAAVLLVINMVVNFNPAIGRWSPWFNPLLIEEVSASDILAWTIQNRIGIALLILAIAALSFARAERREQLLGS